MCGKVVSRILVILRDRLESGRGGGGGGGGVVPWVALLEPSILFY